MDRKKQETQILEETLKLSTIYLDSLMKCIQAVEDPQIKGLLEQSVFREMESRYWLTESLELHKLKGKEQNRVKAN